MSGNNSLNDSSRVLQTILRDLQNASTMFSDLTEKLSNSAGNKAAKDIAAFLESSKLITQADKERIQTSDDLSKVLSKLEDTYTDLYKLEGQHKKRLESTVSQLNDFYKKRISGTNDPAKQAKLQEELNGKVAEALKDQAKAQALSKGITEDYFNAVDNGIPKIREEIKQRTQNVGLIAAQNKGLGDLIDRYKKQAIGLFSVEEGMRHLGRAFDKMYDQANRLTEKGLLGTLMQVNVSAVKLLMTVQDFEKAIGDNRDLILQYGAGVRGIEKFEKTIRDVKGDLGYLGKNANDAAISFIQASKNVGLFDTRENPNDPLSNPKDKIAQKAYMDSLNAMKNQFKKFAGLYGDSAKDYEQLISQQVNEEHVRGRLNTLNKTDASLLIQEIIKRQDNLKAMGLSTDQIIKFNDRLENLYDPEKNNIQQKNSEAVGLENTFQELINRQKADPRFAEQAAALEKQSASMAKYVDILRRGSEEERKKFESSDEYLNLAKEVSRSSTNVFQKGNMYDNTAANAYVEQGGKAYQNMKLTGTDTATAEAKGLNQNTWTPEQRAAREKEAKESVGQGTFSGGALQTATFFEEGLKALSSGPLGDLALALPGLVSAIWLFGGKLKVAASLVSKIIPKFAKWFGLGTGAVAAAEAEAGVATGASSAVAGAGAAAESGIASAGAAGAATGGAAAGAGAAGAAGAGAAGAAAAGAKGAKNVGKLKSGGSLIGRGLAGLGIGSSLWDIYSAGSDYENGRITQAERNKRITQGLGGTVGGTVGLASGGLLGVAGMVGGDLAGSALGNVVGGSNQKKYLGSVHLKPDPRIGPDGKIKEATAGQMPTVQGIGSVSKKYESGSGGAGTISSGAGDPGGASYGTYQLSSSKGTLNKFLSSTQYGSQFQGLTPGTQEFNSRWKQLAATDPNFGQAQHDFIKQTHYDPAAKYASSIGIDMSDPGMQQAVWSASVQHAGVNTILSKAVNSPGWNDMSPEDKIKQLYSVRSQYAMNAMMKDGASQNQINSVQNRYGNEVKDVLAYRNQTLGNTVDDTQLASAQQLPQSMIQGAGQQSLLAQQQQQFSSVGSPSNPTVGSLNSAESIMAPQTSAVLFNKGIDPTQAALNTSPVTKISTKNLPGSSQPPQATIPPVVNDAPVFDSGKEELEELKKHTDLLATIARNTTGGSRILTNPGSFQRDRASNLNGS